MRTGLAYSLQKGLKVLVGEEKFRVLSRGDRRLSLLNSKTPFSHTNYFKRLDLWRRKRQGCSAKSARSLEPTSTPRVCPQRNLPWPLELCRTSPQGEMEPEICFRNAKCPVRTSLVRGLGYATECTWRGSCGQRHHREDQEVSGGSGQQKCVCGGGGGGDEEQLAESQT